ncbi:MAG: alpha-L-rhamnosidase C-terminal domain-containing protein [Luteolibacter sp.]
MAHCSAASAETAFWIAADDTSTPNTWTVFRRTFSLSTMPARVEARVAADTKYWLYVNGRLAVFEGGLKRGPTPTDTYCDTLDLTADLQPGENKIEALVWFFGKDGFSHKNSGRAGFLLELRAPNGAVLLATDGSWRAALHPAWGTAQNGKPNFRLAEPALRYDARQTLADSAFSSARVVASAGAAPWGKLLPRPTPQWSDSGLRDYVSIDGAPLPRISKGETLVARLPYNAQITPWLDVEAPDGAVIDIRTDHYRAGGGDSIHAEYVARTGRQSHESLGWMNGEEVCYTIPAGVTIHALKYRETAYNAGFTGAFSSDDPFLDHLWEKSRRTLLVTMRDTFMDCPDRERAQWWGDAVLQIGQSFYAFSPAATPLAAKAIHELCAWQKPDGALFSPIPAGSWDKELTQQMLASVGRYGFWTYYLQSGDRATAVAAYSHVRTYLALWHLDADGLVEHRKGGWDWADWGNEIDARLLDQGWYCLALEGAANLARLAGKTSEADAYLVTRQRVIDATNRLCWQANAQVYRSPGYTGKTDDRGHGLAVVAGIAGPDKYPAIKRVLAQTKYASPYMEKYVLESLLLMDAPEAFLARLKDRYAGIVADENSTLPELWTTRRAKPGSSTLNHSWTGGPLTLLSQYVAGLSPVEAGWTRYQIRPQLGSLRHVESVVDSAAGRISIKLLRTDDQFTLELDSPAGTTAELFLPVPVVGTPPTSILLNGAPIPASGSPVSLVATGPDRVHLRASPGKYRIELRSSQAGAK